MPVKNIDKIKELYNKIKLFSEKSSIKINALAAISQFCQETGYLLKYSNNNLAGIKCTKSWISKGGKCFTAKTFEDGGNGKMVDTVSGFKYYNSIDEFLSDYSELINNLYPICIQNFDSVYGYFLGLEKGKLGQFAGDPNYFFSLSNMAKLLAPDLIGDRYMSILINNYEVLMQRASKNNWVVNQYKQAHIKKSLNI
jgi:flagellum-specific peptidoglycan hydrolase FlgJ